MKNKKRDLLRNLVSKSISVSNQTYDFAKTPKEESDQYIVDGPALRELLRAYRWNYKTIRKHKDWLPTFHWEGDKMIDHKTEEKVITEGGDGDSPVAKAIWAGVGLVIAVLYLLYHTFLAG